MAKIFSCLPPFQLAKDSEHSWLNYAVLDNNGDVLLPTALFATLELYESVQDGACGEMDMLQKSAEKAKERGNPPRFGFLNGQQFAPTTWLIDVFPQYANIICSIERTVRLGTGFQVGEFNAEAPAHRVH